MIPSIQKVYHLQFDTLEPLLEFQYQLLKYRLCDEVFILNNVNLACLAKNNVEEIDILSNRLKQWNRIYVISGKGVLAEDRLEYLIGDIDDIKRELNLVMLNEKSPIDQNEFLNFINNSTHYPWKIRLKGGCEEIFFLSSYEKIPEFISIVKKAIPKNLGIYIQAINQGTSYHCEFDLLYNPNNEEDTLNIKEKFLKTSHKLMDSGAFFNRPYGLWAKEVYKRHEISTQTALKKVKKIFDPKNVLNPGVLCFDD